MSNTNNWLDTLGQNLTQQQINDALFEMEDAYIASHWANERRKRIQAMWLMRHIKKICKLQLTNR